VKCRQPTFLAFLGHDLSVKVWILFECQPRTYAFLLERSVEESECSDDADDQSREVPKSATLHLPPKLSLSVPASFSSLSSPSFWPLPIHGNDKTVTNRAISEVGSSHRLLPSVPPSPHSPSILGLGQPAMNGLPVSYVVNPNSLPIWTLPFTRLNYAGLPSIKKHRTPSAAWNGICHPHRPNIARPVQVRISP
jgi:hypothetical protein